MSTMINTFKHLQTTAQPTLAHGSVNCLSMFNDDCGGKTGSKVLGDSV